MFLLAEVKDTTFGELSGKVGSRVFRKMNYKQFVSERPEKYKLTKSKALKAARIKFGLTVNFAKYVNSKPALKKIWTEAEVPRINSYQKLIKNNIKLTGEKSLTVKNTIIHPGIPSSVKNPSIRSDKINFSLDVSGKRINNLVKKPFRLHSVIYYYEAKNIKSEPYAFIYNSSYIITSIQDKIYNFQINLDKKHSVLFRKYGKQIFFCTLIPENADSKKFFWTSANGFTLY